MTDRKRSSDDTGVMSTPMAVDQPPPLKKRVSSHPLASDPADDDYNPWAPDFIQQFQKEALFRRMRAFQRSNEALESQVAALERDQTTHLEQITWLCSVWEQLLTDIERIAAVLGVESLGPDESPSFTDLVTTLLTVKQAVAGTPCIPDSSSHLLDRSKALIQHLLNGITRTIAYRNSLSASDGDKAALAETIHQEHQRLAQQVQQRIDGMNNQAAVRNAATAAQTQVQSLRQQLNDSQATVAKLQTKLDRLRCPATMRIFKETPAEQPPTEAVASVPAEAPKIPESTVKTEELEDALKLGEVRLKELERLCEERVQLIRELDHLKLQLSSLPEARIVETGPYKQILARKDFYQTEAQTLKALVDKAQSEIHDLKVSRTQFEETLVNEEKARRKALSAEIKRLEGDVTRLRANRDHIQRLYDASCAKEEMELLANQEIRTLANSRKARIEALSAEVHRLKMKIAADAGDKAATDYYSVNKELSHAEHLGQQLEATKNELAEATRELTAYREAAEGTKELQQALLESKQAQTRADLLQSQLAELHARYGLDATENPDRAASESDTVITQLRAKVDEHAKKASDLEMECAALRVAEQQMLTELENISQGWSQLHEQNSRKVLDLAKRDDQVQHFNTERVKFHQKFVALNKVKDQQHNTNMALKRQVDKVTVYSKSLEDREKSLDKQVKALDKELQASQEAVKACKSRLEELMLRNSELTDAAGRAEQRANEVQRALNERTAQLEKEAHHARRIGEECAGYKRKLERVSKDQMDEQLRSERDEYKALLKCSSCSTRFKSHVLLRCMHVFCHECIQARLETRQRKCPSCAEPFGANDVKKVFL